MNIDYMTIRSAKMIDTERIAATHRASVQDICSECYTPHDIVRWIEVLTPNIYQNAIQEKFMIVAEEEDKIVGLGILDLEHKEIGAVYIHPQVQGTGIGKRLLQELEARAVEDNVEQLALCSTINALGFYQHHGYISEGQAFHELPNGVRLECIRMFKTLS